VFLLSGVALHAQVSIVNTKHETVPAGRPEAIYRSALNVVDDTFGRDSSADFPVTLVLGEENEHYVADADHNVNAIYLAGWNENKFAVSMIHLAMEHLIDTECRNNLLGEIIVKSNAISPVSLPQIVPAKPR
jgi:hypothetical protein